jgi:hypothetical protein
MTPAAKTYTKRMVLVFVVYTIAIFGAGVIDNRLDLDQPLRVALAIIPVLPVLACVWVIVAFVRAMDEVQSRIVLESALIGAVLVAVLSFTYGMLRGVTELPAIDEVWYLPAFIAVSGLAQIFVRQRYA